MTFYNIIFGILFLGAAQVAVTSLATPGQDWLLLTLVAVLIFTDAVNTSEVVEGRRVEYTIWMKLWDLGSFVALSAALVLLSGTTKNFLIEPDVYGRFPDWLKTCASLAPAMLIAYCACVAGWILSSPSLRTRREWPWPLIGGATAVVLAVVLATILRAVAWQETIMYTLAVSAGIVGALVYLIWYTKIPKDAPADLELSRAKANATAADGFAQGARASADTAGRSAEGAKASAQSAESMAERAKSAAKAAAADAASIEPRANP